MANRRKVTSVVAKTRACSERKGVSYVVHNLGKPLKKFRRSWSAVAKAAGHGQKDGPHIMRHTAATRQMQAGTLLAEAAGYLGMSPETLWNVYSHHHPDFTFLGEFQVLEVQKLLFSMGGPDRSAGEKRPLARFQSV